MIMSKKDALTLGILAIGGIAAASAVASGAEGDTGAVEGAGGILGTFGGTPQGSVGNMGAEAPSIYQMSAQPEVRFPEQPDYTDFLSQFLTPQAQPISRGAQGVSAAPKKIPTYIHTGGEIKPGAVSLAPWAKAPEIIQPYGYTGGEVKTGAVTVAPWAMVKPAVVSRKKAAVVSRKTKSVFSSTSYQKSYQARAKKRYAKARKERMSKKESST